MARDHALARCLAPETGAVRLYGWREPTVSFGRHEPAASRYDPSGHPGRGLTFVRRPTGGRAVLHDRELTYAVVVPSRALGGTRVTYTLIHEALASGLGALGAEVELAGDGGPPRRPLAGPCFASPAAGELVTSGRKLVGSAQARIEGALLQHGSMILEDDQHVLAELADEWHGARAAALSELLEDVDVDAVSAAVLGGLRARLGGHWTEADYTRAELAEAERLEREIYASDSWTWRC